MPHRNLRTIFIALFSVLATTHAYPMSRYDDEGVLALAALVGAHWPLVTPEQKTLLVQALDGNVHSIPPNYPRLDIKADKVTCIGLAGDLTKHSCDINFPQNNAVTITGREAHELYATIGEAGVPMAPAAGMRYESMQNLSCIVDFETLRESRSGISCTFTNGPE
jgi:hypothetical protein